MSRSRFLSSCIFIFSLAIAFLFTLPALSADPPDPSLSAVPLPSQASSSTRSAPNLDRTNTRAPSSASTSSSVPPRLSRTLAPTTATTSTQPPDCSRIGWSPLGSGVNGTVTCMASFDDGTGPALYVAGSFTDAGGWPVVNIARWKNQHWEPVFPFYQGLAGTVSAMIVFDDGSGPALFVGGDFTLPGQTTRTHVAKYDSQTWLPLLEPYALSQLLAMAIHDDGSGPALYVAGKCLSFSCGLTNHVVLKFDSATRTWIPFVAALPTTSGRVTSILTDEGAFDQHDSLFIGGYFSHINSSPASSVARWHAGQWSALSGAPSVATALVVFHGPTGPLLIAASQTGISTWDGTAWSEPEAPDGLSSIDALLPVYVGNTRLLFVGGTFQSYNPVQLNSIGKWDGRVWYRLSYGITPDQFGHGWSVKALHVWNDGSPPKVIVGGNFVLAGGNPAPGIAVWSPVDVPQDLNSNQFADMCDISLGLSTDCDVDLQPDEVQFDMSYQLDDDFPTLAFGTDIPSDMFFLNQFRVQPGQHMIDALSIIASPFARDRLPIRMFLLSDPNNDGDPHDAQVLAEGSCEEFFNDHSTYPLPTLFARIQPTVLGPIGHSFFVGALVSASSPQFWMGASKVPVPSGRSWYTGDSLDTYDPYARGNIYLNDSGSPFTWCIRAVSSDCNLNGTWDQCDIDSGSSLDLNNNTIPDECESPCDADLVPLGGDGQINIDDVLAVLTRWGPCDPGACWTDLDHSNATDIGDLSALILHWGNCSD